MALTSLTSLNSLTSPFAKVEFFIFEIILSSHFEIVISNQGFVPG